MKGRVELLDLGLIEYGECVERQRAIFDPLVAQKSSKNKSKGCEEQSAHPSLILCQHPHVYTLGKSGEEHNLLISDEFLKKIEATYYQTDRGGDITYHGPGQLVGYPILDLDQLGIGLREYINLLEQTIIDTVAHWGIESGQRADATGVWLEREGSRPDRKICAIGVKSSRFVTMHGFALNVDTNMEYYNYINPCGITDKGVTSMAAELGKEIGVEEVAKVFAEKFEEHFEVKLIV